MIEATASPSCSRTCAIPSQTRAPPICHMMESIKTNKIGAAPVSR
jgi:hypothetical protein